MSSLNRYLAERRNSRELSAASPDGDNSRAVAATEDRIARAAQAAYADGYTSQQLADAEDHDRRR